MKDREAWHTPVHGVSPVPFPGDLADPGIELGSPTLQADSLLSEPPGKPPGKAPRRGLHRFLRGESPAQPTTLWELHEDRHGQKNTPEEPRGSEPCAAVGSCEAFPPLNVHRETPRREADLFVWGKKPHLT